MRPEGFDTISQVSGERPDDICLIQRYHQRGPIPALASLTAAACLIAVPQLALAASALAVPAVRARIADDPLTAVQLAIAMLLWISLVVFPITRIARRLRRQRAVRMAGGVVHVSDRFGRQTHQWSEPIRNFQGLARASRSSFTATRDEIVLVHADPRRSVILRAENTISSADVRAWATRLGLPELPAAAIYGFPSLGAKRTPSAAQLGLTGHNETTEAAGA